MFVFPSTMMRGSGGFGPNSLPGSLMVHLDSATPNKMFTTAAGSTPSTDGAALAGWESVGATLGRLNTTDSGANAFTARSEGGFLVGEALLGDKALSVALTKTWTAQTVYCLHRLTVIDTSGSSFFTMGAAQATPWYGVRNATATQMRAQPYATAQSAGVTPVMATKYAIVAFVFDGAGGKCSAYYDDAEKSGTLGGVAAPASVDGVLISLGRGAASGPTNQRIAALAVYDAAHTAAQVRAMMAYWRTRYASLFTPSENYVIFTGSSHMMDNSPGTDGAGLAALCLSGSTKFAQSYNMASSGITTPFMTSRLTSESAHIAAWRSGQLVVAHHCGGNDISAGGMTAQQVYDNLCLYHDAWQAIRADTPVVIGTYLPQTGVDNAIRNAGNDIIRADAQGLFVGRIADMASDPDMGGDGQNANTVYFKPDGTHVTATGAVRQATYLSPPIEAQFP